MGPGMEGARHALDLTAGVRWHPVSPQKGGRQSRRTGSSDNSREPPAPRTQGQGDMPRVRDREGGTAGGAGRQCRSVSLPDSTRDKARALDRSLWLQPAVLPSKVLGHRRTPRHACGLTHVTAVGPAPDSTGYQTPSCQVSAPRDRVWKQQVPMTVSIQLHRPPVAHRSAPLEILPGHHLMYQELFLKREIGRAHV